MSTTAGPFVVAERRESAPPTASDRRLIWVALLFTVAVLTHNADHLRRGADAVTWEVFWLGTAAIPLEVGIVVLICARHRLAPFACFAGGVTLAIGYLAVHFLPRWSALSDSFTSANGVSPLSWSAASTEVVAALALAFVGYITLRQRGGMRSATLPRPSERSLAAGLVHPVALTMAVGNFAVLIVAFVQYFSR